MKVLSLDPSVNNVGWCVFDTTKRVKTTAWKWGTWHLEGGSLEMRILNLAHQIARDIGEDFHYLITERPAFYSSQAGIIAARQNYTIDLAAVNYFIAGWFHKDHRSHFAITASRWKGMVSKEITARHFFRNFRHVLKGGSHVLSLSNITEHAIDATMLLRWWLENYAMAAPLIVRHTSAESIAKLL